MVSHFSGSLPPNLKAFCQDPPWRASPSLFERVSASTPEGNYRKVELLPSDPEYQFVWKYFYHQQPTNRIIQSIYFIHNPRLSTSFESQIDQMELEADNLTFQPSWKEEEPKPLRQKVYRRFEKLSSPHTPFTIPSTQ